MIFIERALLDTPYNSFGKILLSEGDTYPETYGGNCVFQCRRLTSAIITSNLDLNAISYATATEKPHWVVFMNDGDEYMLDPFLLCPEPINISKVKKGETQVLDAYPKGVNKIEAKLLEGGCIQVVLFTKKGSTFKQVLTHTYDLSRPNTRVLPPDNYQILAGLRQKNLEMGILMNNAGNGEVLRIYRQPGQQNMHVKINGGQHYCHNHLDFGTKITEIVNRLCPNKDVFMKFWNRGENLYLQKQSEAFESGDDIDSSNM